MRIGRLAAVGAVLWATAAMAGEDPGYAVSARGGVGTYTGGLNTVTEAGPVWGASFRFDPSRIFSIELGYEGSSNSVDDPRVTSGARLQRLGADALLRLGYPVTPALKPFVGLGLGTSFVFPNRDASLLLQRDMMEEIPMAGGVELNTGWFTAGLRATYRMLLDESFADGAVPAGGGQGGMLGASFTLGGRF